MVEGPRPDALVRRYLAAFGPANVTDAQRWSGLTRLGGVFENLRPSLRVYHSDQGELFDLPDGRLADPEIPAPVRFLPAYDNPLLGHVDRTRIIAYGDRKLVMPGGGQVLPTLLVDGFVAGTWGILGSTLHLTSFRPLSPPVVDQVHEEAEGLLGFLFPDDENRAISVD